MVEREEDLSNAIALNSFLFNSARLIGPSIGGFLISILGEGICFMINAISYLAVLIALLFMKVKPMTYTKTIHIISELKEGFYYAFKTLVVKYILIFIAISSLLSSIYSVLLPIFAKDILHGGPETLGILTGSIGAGALLGAIFLAGRQKIKGIEKIIAQSFGTAGLGLLVFSISRNLYSSLLALFITGLSFMLISVCSNTLIQSIIDNHIRGRGYEYLCNVLYGSNPYRKLFRRIFS